MLFISTQPAVHAAPCHSVGLFSLFSIVPPLGGLFLASIEIKEFSGIDYHK